MKKISKVKKIAVLVSLFALLVSGCNQNAKQEVPTNGTADEGQNEKNEPTVEPINPEKPEPEQERTEEETVELLWKSLYELAEPCQAFYTDNFTKTRLITRSGLLYNKASETLVDLEYLKEEGVELPEEELGINVLLLYPRDLKKFEELAITDGDELTVFLSAKHPSQDAYFIVSEDSKGGILSGDKYRSLLESYTQNHGEIRRIEKASEEYGRILDFVRMYESKYEEYFVRSMLVDDKYATVILSSTQNTADIRQYILQKENTVWKVVMDDLEGEPRAVVAINKNLVDFNLSMLMNTSIYDYRNGMKKDYVDVIQVLMEEALLDNIGDLYYTCGTKEYCYLATTTGKRFLTINQDGQWQVQEVESAVKARELLLAEDKFAPVFIVLDD